MKTLKEQLTEAQVQQILEHYKDHPYTLGTVTKALQTERYWIELSVFDAHAICMGLGKELSDIYYIFQNK